MGLWHWWTGRLRTIRDGGVTLHNWPGALGSYERDSGEAVTPETALKLSAWNAAVRLKTETIATLPCAIFQKKGEDREAVPDHWLYKILHDKPNTEQTPVEFWEGRVGPLCSYGNSYAEKRYLGENLVSLLPMRADRVEVLRRKGNYNLYYKYTDHDGKDHELTPDKVFHIKGFAPNDEDEGLSPIQYASRSLGGAMSAERVAARIYGRGLRASGFFSPPVDMTKEQREQFQKNFIAPYEGPQGEGKTPVFPPGFDWKAMSISPRDAELLMSRAFNVEDVCRWQRVPPILIGHASAGQTMWGSGVEQVILGWLVLGLRADLRRIESAVNFRLLTDTDRAAGISFEFNFEGLLRADSAARASLMATLVQNGLRTPNEQRKIDNYAAMPGGDELIVQSNLTKLTALDTQQQQASVMRNAMRSWLLDERKNAA